MQHPSSPSPPGVEDIVTVIDRGMCVGCGACSVATSGRVPVTIGRYGAHTASVSGVSMADVRQASTVCPFTDVSRNEDEIAADHLPATNKQDDRIGSFHSLFAGRVLSDQYLEGSSSGGLTSWFASRLLEEDLVDAIIHVGAGSTATPDRLFEYTVSDNPTDAEKHRKSAYYSVNLADALSAIRGTPRRYALIGVPCMIRATRLLCEQDDELAARITYFIGLVCGHMKSPGFAESMAWQAGVPTDDLAQVDFRVKDPTRSAGDYNFAARSAKSGKWELRRTQALVGGNWGHGMFQLGACNFCDDIFAETADITFGDAWLPEYRDDWRGTNIVVSRRDELSSLFLRGAENGQIFLDTLSPDATAASQGGNFRHRRLGLSVRLHDDAKLGLPIPRKRVPATIAHVPRKRRRIARLRRQMTDSSHESFLRAKDTDDLGYFLDAMRPLMQKYARVEARPLLARVWSRSRKIIARLRSGS